MASGPNGFEGLREGDLQRSLVDLGAMRPVASLCIASALLDADLDQTRQLEVIHAITDPVFEPFRASVAPILGRLVEAAEDDVVRAEATGELEELGDVPASYDLADQIEALMRARADTYDFWTPTGLAEHLSVEPDAVQDVLEGERFRKPLAPDGRGRTLYTIADRRPKWNERYALIRLLITKSPY